MSCEHLYIMYVYKVGIVINKKKTKFKLKLIQRLIQSNYTVCISISVQYLYISSGMVYVCGKA